MCSLILLRKIGKNGIYSNSRIPKTHWHTSAYLETFTARGGHSNLSFKKISLKNLYIGGNWERKKSKTLNAYSALLDNVRTKILFLSERSKSKLSFRRKKALKLYKIWMFKVGGVLPISRKLTISVMCRVLLLLLLSHVFFTNAYRGGPVNTPEKHPRYVGS